MKKLVINHLIIAAFVVAVAFTSCNKDRENINTVKLLKTLTYYPEDGFEKWDKYKFEYDEQNRITKMSEYSYGGVLSYTSTYTYSGDDLILVLYSNNNDISGDEKYEYTKSGNTITQKYTYIGGTYIPAYTGISTIELDGDGVPVKRTTENEPGETNVETFYYQDGNMTQKTNRYTSIKYDYSESHSQHYSYDHQKGALYHCKTPKWLLILHLNDFGVTNNITEKSWIRYNAEYTYKFDGAGFPAKRQCRDICCMSSREMKWEEKFTYITK